MIWYLVHLFWRESVLCVFIVLSAIVWSFLFLIRTTVEEAPKLIPYHNYTVLRLSPTTEFQVAELRKLQLNDERLDFWTDATALNTSIDIMIPPNNLKYFENLFERRKISYDIFVDDVQRFVKVINIGNSFEGRPLRVVKIGKPVKGGEKPAIWIDAGTHGREWIGPATAVYIIDQLVYNYTEYQELIEQVDWYIYPIANPDGYEYTHTHLRLWRKTRSKVATDTGCVGVDPNRNFDFYWNVAGASKNPCSDTYAGENPFSEPETKALADFILKQKNIKVFLSLHSYKQLILIPWGHTKAKPVDFNEMIKLGQRAVDAIQSVSGTMYQVGSSIDLLYTTSGSSRDWAKGVAGINYSYTIELRDSGKFGFLLPPSEIVAAASETMEAIRVFAEKALNG